MKLAYIGTGYVGQVNAAASASMGHQVWLVDVVPAKIDSINAGKPTIYERGLEDLLQKLVLKDHSLRGTLDLEDAIRQTEISFICVGTPDKGEMIDLSYIRAVAIGIGKAIKKMNNYHLVVVKSTVVPGTTLKVVKPLVEEYSGKTAGKDFGIAMNPEFLREGVAVEDALHPDSIVLGTESERDKRLLTAAYEWAPANKITHVGVTAAECIKYAKNSFLATKITFANEWANFCDQIGVDVQEVMTAIGLDRRVGPFFLRSGPGYGGSCFPKDVNAIVHEGVFHNSPFQILETVVKVNKRQYLKLIELAQKVIGPLQGKRVGVLGLSFKPDTDDTRESPALSIINLLDSLGCQIQVYCPQGMHMAKEWLQANRIEVTYCVSATEAASNVDLVFIPTDWAEFREILSTITVPVFVGHRDFINPQKYPHVYSLGYPKRK
jgi:UDPglucose 6-dehydrogenase